IEVIHPDRVGMLELSGNNGFALEAFEEILVGQTLIDHFDGANLVEGQMPGPINRGHAAGADFFQDAIFLGNDEPFNDLGAGAQGGIIARTHVEVGGISGTAGVAILHQRAPYMACVSMDMGSNGTWREDGARASSDDTPSLVLLPSCFDMLQWRGI